MKMENDKKKLQKLYRKHKKHIDQLIYVKNIYLNNKKRNQCSNSVTRK